MSLPELLLIAVGLSMDAFAVSLCAGLTMPAATVRKALTVGLYFGCFQAAMPLAGYLLATRFADKIAVYDHWIAFALLGFIGGKMIVESFRKEEEKTTAETSLKLASMLPLAVATSIDALAAGVSFVAFEELRILPTILTIGAVTLLLSFVGAKAGRLFGTRLGSKAGLAGGVILVLMGLKILLEHLDVFTL